ncbi:LicD family protein [Neptunicella sp. SCSIO 80796]|uniref:LicD family protein n=1 Tax=Neptunicella plasticusilytica TaxID=3117012 RepID=UPI003A4DDD48
MQQTKQAVIFGAGQAGIAALTNLADDFDVVAFCDNDATKHDTQLHQLPVISPQHLSRYPTAHIIVASEFAEQIQTQLITELAITKKRIQILSWSALKLTKLGHAETKAHAIYLLTRMCRALNEKSICYYVDAGTLLGIIRDQQLIPWDDDLDLALKSDELELTIQVVEALLPELTSITGVSWVLEKQFAKQAFGAVPQGGVRAMKLRPEQESTNLPMMDFFIKYVEGEQMDYCLASRGIRMPSRHILQLDTHEFCGQRINIPSDVEDYLQAHYGDWRTPKKDWGLHELTNATLL